MTDSQSLAIRQAVEALRDAKDNLCDYDKKRHARHKNPNPAKGRCCSCEIDQALLALLLAFPEDQLRKSAKEKP